MTTTDDSATDFWDLVEPMLASGEVEQGTIMSSACIRVDGEFLAMPHHKEAGLVVKLPRARVDELVGAGTGRPFAPAGKVFREWVHIPDYDEELWLGLLAEGRTFVSGG